MPYCGRCHEYLLFETTLCSCIPFECCVPEWDGSDEWNEQYAWDAESAAIKYVENADCGEYYCLKNEILCKVRDRRDGSILEFHVSAETDIHYYAARGD